MNVERDYWIFHYGLNQYSHQCAWPASQITIECSLWFQTTLKHSTNIKSDIHSTSHYTSVSLLLIMQFRLSHLQSNGLIGTVKISNDLLIQITIIQIQFLVTNISTPPRMSQLLTLLSWPVCDCGWLSCHTLKNPHSLVNRVPPARRPPLAADASWGVISPLYCRGSTNTLHTP